MEQALGAQQAGEAVGGRGARGVAGDQVHGALLEESGGFAPVVALDAAVGGVGSAAVDPGEGERPAVDPGAVVVAVDQAGGAVRDGRVELLPGGGAAVEGVHGPAAAGDPVVCGVRVGIGPYGRDSGGGVAGAGEVALGEFLPGGDRVDVGVLEAGEQEASGEVHHLGARADEFAYLVMADGGDPVAGDGDRRRAGAGGVRRVDGTAGEDEIGGGAGHGGSVSSGGCWGLLGGGVVQAGPGTGSARASGATERPVTK